MSTEIESLHEYRFGRFEIRFWQREEFFFLSPGYDLENRSAQALAHWSQKACNEPITLRLLADWLSKLPYCNAVQIRENSGAAIVIYPEWP